MKLSQHAVLSPWSTGVKQKSPDVEEQNRNHVNSPVGGSLPLTPKYDAEPLTLPFNLKVCSVDLIHETFINI